MPGLIDVTGERFGRLLVLDRKHSRQGHRYWRCVCDCGTETVIRASYLRNGRTRSCGCLRRERAASDQYRHGHARHGQESPTWRSWIGLVTRCVYPTATGFQNYGGRGIKVCDRWLGEDGFSNFLADMGERPEGMSIDRIDPDGDYEPGNCRWATRSEQRRNQRKT